MQTYLDQGCFAQLNTINAELAIECPETDPLQRLRSSEVVTDEAKIDAVMNIPAYVSCLTYASELKIPART